MPNLEVQMSGLVGRSQGHARRLACLAALVNIIICTFIDLSVPVSVLYLKYSEDGRLTRKRYISLTLFISESNLMNVF